MLKLRNGYCHLVIVDAGEDHEFEGPTNTYNDWGEERFFVLGYQSGDYFISSLTNLSDVGERCKAELETLNLTELRLKHPKWHRIVLLFLNIMFIGDSPWKGIRITDSIYDELAEAFS